MYRAVLAGVATAVAIRAPVRTRPARGGSDAASNALFGSLQNITAHDIGRSPVLVVGGVMGEMIDAPSIMVASAACDERAHALGPIFP